MLVEAVILPFVLLILNPKGALKVPVLSPVSVTIWLEPSVIQNGVPV